MSKFVIECPVCGRYAEANGGLMGFFSSKKIPCGCGYTIDVRTDKMATRDCPHCGNSVLFDQSKGEAAICPVCHEKVNTRDSLHNLVSFSCPSCSCNLSADRNAASYTCPLCETQINVQNQLAKEKIMNEGVASVIKYEGDMDTLIWKHPIEDFNMGSQLIVHESQEAIFFRDGQALDLFGAGRYTLETHQLPIMEKMYELPSDSQKTFHSEVYYINHVAQMAFKWGTSEKVTLIDPTSQAPIAIGARGMFNFKVSDSRKMLMKLVGTTTGLTRADIFGPEGKSHAKDYFRSIVQLGVSTKLAEIIREQNIDILQIDQEKLKLSRSLQEAMAPYFDDYGMEITEFLVEGIILPQAGELGYDVVQTLIKLRQKNLTKQVIETETDIKLTEMEAKKTVDIRAEENRVEVETAHRQTVAAKGQTEILEAQIEGQKKVAETQYDVEAQRMQMQLEMERKAQMAQIEAQEMQAKGFSQKDVLQADVMRAFAENQPSGGAGMGNMAGQALNMGANFATMGAMAGMASNMMGTGAQLGRDMTGAMAGAMAGMTAGVAGSAQNPGMPQTNPENISVSTSGWTMPTQPAAQPGAVPPTAPAAEGWNCGCGTTGISTNFCPNCGTPRPQPAQPATWDCECGTTGISTNFCPNCGKPRA